MRKRYLVNLESRTSEQLVEEEALYVEIRRLEQTERRFKKEREELFRTLAGMDSGLPEIVEDDGGPLGVAAGSIVRFCFPGNFWAAEQVILGHPPPNSEQRHAQVQHPPWRFCPARP